MGLSIVKALIQAKYYVVFVGSNNKKGMELEMGFNSASHEKCAEFRCLDLSNLGLVHSFSIDFINRHNRLDLLANVAGVILPKREITGEGFEKTFAIGYLSTFILSIQLAVLLKESAGARIVNVSAQAKSVMNTNVDVDDLTFSKNYNGFSTSLLTVHAKTVLTDILAKNFLVHGIDVNSFHPGIVRSDLTRHLPFPLRILAKAISPIMSKTSENGIFVCSSQDLKGATGQLFVNRKPIALSFNSTYKEALWTKTKELLKSLYLDQ